MRPDNSFVLNGYLWALSSIGREKIPRFGLAKAIEKGYICIGYLFDLLKFSMHILSPNSLISSFKRCFIGMLLFASMSLTLKGQTAAVTVNQPPLAIWFDTPTTLLGRMPWYGGRPELWEGNDRPVIQGPWDENENKEWETASLPIGNGSIGANILGSVEAERITFNEKSLWRGGPNNAKGADYYWNVNKESAHLLPLIREAFEQGDEERAALLTRKNFNSEVSYEAADEPAFRFGNFTTMGEFYVETGLSSVGMSHYRRSLSLDSALATVSFVKDKVSYRREYFISYPHQVLVMRFTADQPGRQNLTLSYAPNPESNGSMQAIGQASLCYEARLKSNQMAYTVRITALPSGGTLQNDGQRLLIKGADEVVFLVTADTDYRMNFDPDFTDPTTYVGVNPSETTAQWMAEAQKQGYEGLLKAHLNDYQALFQRVKFELNPSANASTTANKEAAASASHQTIIPDYPTPERLKRYRQGESDFYLEQLYYQYGRYLLIASSRPGNLPAHLQGLWHNHVDGPWRVDYHNNINILMNYWPACSTGLSDCMVPLIDFIRLLQKPGQRTAKAYFGARGWTASISANIFGFTTPLRDEDMSWNFNPMAGPWLATHLWEYYDYTRDKAFLQQVGYPLIRESARFAVDYLWHKPDGSYTAAPSTSPEHGPIDQGATFVHAVVREILLNAIEASRLLGCDKGERKRREEVLNHLAPYAIGRYGQLMEWSRDIDDPDDHHRHVNHLFGLHPGHTISPITTPQLADAARVVLTHRGDGATGWSMGWKLNQWARLHDGNHAYMLYQNLLRNGTLDNLWDTHPPFQIDGNFGGTAGVTEMLLQSHAGFIHLLPSLPEAWSEGAVSGLEARGNFMVSLRWQGGELSEVTLLSRQGGRCTLRYKGAEITLNTQKGRCYRLSYLNGELSSDKPGARRHSADR